MKVTIISTKNCNHHSTLETYLQELDVVYSVQYFDDNQELIQRYGKGHSLILLVDDKVEFSSSFDNCLPTFKQLKQLFNKISN